MEQTRLGIPVDFTNEGIRGLCPVSYTHLDVYKRQVLKEYYPENYPQYEDYIGTYTATVDDYDEDPITQSVTITPKVRGESYTLKSIGDVYKRQHMVLNSPSQARISNRKTSHGTQISSFPKQKMK